MRNNAILRIVLFSLAILVLLGILIAGFGLRYAFHHLELAGSKLTNVLHVDEQIDYGDLAPVTAFDPSEIRDIEIDWAAGSIAIIPSDTATEITVSETEVSSEGYKMNCQKSGSKLSIEFSDTKVYFGISFDKPKDLLIEVPSGWICETLEIDTASARVELNDLTVHEFDFDGASGICNITNCHIDEIDVDTASGDVNFTGTLDRLDCDAASATCRITLTNIPRSIELDSVSGDLDLTLPADCGFRCALDSMSGHFSSDFETTHHNGAYTHGDGYCRINVSAMSGDVNICKSDESYAPTVPTKYCTVPDCTDAHHHH